MKITLISAVVLLLLSSCSYDENYDRKLKVVITFDDCHLSIYETAFPLMQGYGFRGTNIVCSGRPGKSGYYNWQQLSEMADCGWEVVSHTVNHVNLSEVTLEEAEQEITEDLSNLREMGYKPESFALPSGIVSMPVYEILCRYFLNIRTSADTENYYPIDRKATGYYPIQSHYKSEEPMRRLQLAEYRGECLIILGFHRILPENSDFTDNCKPHEFIEILEYIAKQGYEVITMQQALDLCSE
jgi:peptidoglycan/xylan/chitin deacetylase (PgdA/CDA1 family)